MTRAVRDRLTAIRRELHQYPEPAWREFYTTSRLVDELEALDVDELAVGREALSVDDRMAVPDEDELDAWLQRAREAGAREDVLELTAGGYTGVVAVLECGEGPTVGLRVDIDALPVTEADDADHHPAAAGFRSGNEGYMHACGHDAHMTIGLGTIEAVQESDFSGTLVVFFQPAEEESGGGKAMAESPYAEGIEYFLAVHVGLGHPTGEVVAGIEKPLAMSHLDVRFRGEAAHAGKEPNEGRNALLAASTAVQNLYAVPRHADGMTRVNVGKIEGGTASNVVADDVHLLGEVRGETTPLRDYMKAEVERTLAAAADMHDCEVTCEVVSESPRADSDPALTDLVYDVAAAHPDVDAPVRTAEFGASEDATFLMRAVQAQGGQAAYAIVGTDHPAGHHESRFDVDEASLDIGIDVLAGSIRQLGVEST